jgi:hypothetical protein
MGVTADPTTGDYYLSNVKPACRQSEFSEGSFVGSVKWLQTKAFIELTMLVRLRFKGRHAEELHCGILFEQ